MVAHRIQPEELDVRHVREPRQRMPIARRRRLKCPDDAGRRQSALDVCVGGDVGRIIIIDKTARQRAAKNRQRRHGQRQADRPGAPSLWRDGIHCEAGNMAEERRFILAIRNKSAVPRQPNPYVTLRRKLIDDASSKYLVGQLTSAIV